MDERAVDAAVRLHDVVGERRVGGRPADALVPCEQALAILERECGDGHPDVANVLLTLGGVHESLGGYGERSGVPGRWRSARLRSTRRCSYG